MTDTIDLLETIGTNAALRYAPAEELEKVMVRMQASDLLRQAASSGNIDHIKLELQPKELKSVQAPPAPGPGPNPQFSRKMTPPPPPPAFDI